MAKYRIEKDSLGKVRVPADALYGAQTQRAIENFPISGTRLPRRMIQALGTIKAEASRVNARLGLLPTDIAKGIRAAALEVAKGKWDQEFPIDIYQTGSGTSSNMNANEVIARRARQILGGTPVHPNDHVNLGQSSNDVFPSAIRVAAVMSCTRDLMPGLTRLRGTLLRKGKQYESVAKTGRTHLMDAMPVTFGQVFRGYARQVELGEQRVRGALERVAELPLGGTAVGTGVNTDARFGRLMAAALTTTLKVKFREAADHFEAQGTLDACVELSGALRTIAVSLLKIVNDLRWMNSGPIAGLGEIALPALQPGSSIMPAKVNPVVEESTAMVCAQVIGYDAAVAVGGMSGSFELNVMMPMVAHSLLESIRLLSNASRNLADKSVSRLHVNKERINDLIGRNPILVTALNPLIGYDLAAKIAKRALKEGRSLREVALQMTKLTEKELKEALDPRNLTRGGLRKKKR